MDVSLKNKFTLKATIFVQISNYPGLFSPIGADQREERSLICLVPTMLAYLMGSNNMVYMRHKQFLANGYMYRSVVMNK